MKDGLSNIRQLAAFAATVRYGSVTAASHRLGLTQPAMTQAIARLEADLGCRLFEREPSGMRPTEPALMLAPRAEKAIRYVGSSRVTTTQILAFIALAKAGSYAAAAKRIGLSSASLHRSVSDLSIALGERLVERRGRHLAFTRKGERRARDFGLALAEMRSGYAEVSSWLGKAGARIVIGAMPLSRARWLPRSILSFRRDNPEIDVTIVEGSHSELSGPLRDGEIDFLLGALRDEAGMDDLRQLAVFEDRPKLIMRKGHALASVSGGITLAQLRDYPWVLSDPQTPLFGYWEAMMARDKQTVPHVPIVCGSVLTIRELLLETDMVTLLSPAQLRVEIEAGLLVAREPPDPVRRIIGITTRLDWRPTRSQQAMIDILCELGDNSS